jgi:glycogen(starch) synthase
LRIAYISFEYPPDSAFGGIATYVHQVSKLMNARAHQVEVFCSSPLRNVSEQLDGILVHRIKSSDRSSFHQDILSKFSERHDEQPFDLIESPEYYADGYTIKRKYPSLPVVIKLHTPQFLIHEMTNHYVSSYTKIRYMAGGVLRGRISKPFWKWKKKESDIEYQFIKVADQIHTPSVSLGDIVSEKWNIPRTQIYNVPNPFIPNQDFLNIPITQSSTRIFSFIGRLEVRKGLIKLVAAAARVFSEIPDAKFRIIGVSLQSHIPGLSMKEYIIRELKAYTDRIEFLEVSNREIPSVLSSTDVCVYPSIWENFPNVCLEAMSAGKAIVGSIKGGMKDMLEDPEAGILVDPESDMEIAVAIIKLLNDPALRMRLGEAARKKVLDSYNSDAIGRLMETHYYKLARAS